MTKSALPMLLGLPLWAVLGALASPPASAAEPGMVPQTDDYPTAAKAEYVFACMNVNGGTQDALRRCACSIDVIAAAVPYADYERAETVLRMRRLAGGYLAEEFRVETANEAVRRLREAQAEAEVRCF